jgi:NAD(P)-dependent dehydrogenase (short-subunit alcohol dehydrogenase family)
VRRILVTGSTTGLGRAAAETLLADGHDVVMQRRDLPRTATSDAHPTVFGEQAAGGQRVVR